MGRERLRDEVIGWGALLLFAVVGSALIVGCDNGGGGQPRVDPVFAAQVANALGEMERRGLGEWAKYGREQRHIIRYLDELVPPGELAYTWRFIASDGQAVYTIALGDKWRALGLPERGLVLLTELYHVRTGDMGYSDLAPLQERYNDAETASAADNI